MAFLVAEGEADDESDGADYGCDHGGVWTLKVEVGDAQDRGADYAGGGHNVFTLQGLSP